MQTSMDEVVACGIRMSMGMAKTKLHTDDSTMPETAQEDVPSEPKSDLFKQPLAEPKGVANSHA